jgi:hypothetical protein
MARGKLDCSLPDAHRRTLRHADSCSESGACVPNDVLLQLHPSLPSLRRKLPSIVRPVHRYYGAVRLLQYVHARVRLLPSRAGLRIFPKAHWRSPGSRACCLVSVPGLFDYAGPDSHSQLTRLPCCLPLSRNRVGILFFRLFEAQSPRPLTPPAYASKPTSR